LAGLALTHVPLAPLGFQPGEELVKTTTSAGEKGRRASGRWADIQQTEDAGECRFAGYPAG
jgi:hypothetical protein